jgi:hypothetical protein
MSNKTKTTTPAGGAQDAAAPTAYEIILKRQRENMHRALLKRRQRKSNQ